MVLAHVPAAVGVLVHGALGFPIFLTPGRGAVAIALGFVPLEKQDGPRITQFLKNFVSRPDTLQRSKSLGTPYSISSSVLQVKRLRTVLLSLI